MIDRIFTAALTFCVLVGGTLAVGAEFIGSRSRAPDRQPVQTVQLPTAQLPTVQIVGKRVHPQTDVAAVQSPEPKVRRVE